jgi:hypothetical protein
MASIVRDRTGPPAVVLVVVQVAVGAVEEVA